jgi:DNA polymerase-1
MEPTGNGQMQILLCGEAPGDVEDHKGVQFVGPTGSHLDDSIRELGIEMHRDCFLTNAIQCKLLAGSGKKKAKMDFWADCCRARLETQILRMKPRLIIAFGAPAMRAILRPKFGDPGSTQYHGLVFPSLKFNCWVGCCWHPSYVTREIEKGNESIQELFLQALATFLDFLGKPIPAPLPENHIVLKDFDLAREFLQGMCQCTLPTAFDYETTRLHPSGGPESRIYCASFSTNPEEGFWLPLQMPAFWTPEQQVELLVLLGEWLRSPCPKVIQNRSMEERWSASELATEIENVINDTMVTHHVIYNRARTTNLGFQSFMLRGVDYKGEVNVEQNDWCDHEPIDKVIKYSCYDSQYTLLAHQEQQKILDREPVLKQAAGFFLKCLKPLIRMEVRGFAVDKKRLADQRKEAETKQAECANFIAKHEFVEQFKKKFDRDSWGPGSDKDFIDLFYRTLGLKPPPWTTEGGGYPSDKDAVAFILKSVQDAKLKEFFEKMLSWRRYDTLLSTFIGGFERALQPDGLIHPSFLLNTVASYRSSSSNPNLQNLPKRAEEHSEFRKIVIPHVGSLITEADASGSEVVTIAMMSGDAVLIQQIKEKFDPHRYWATKLWEWDDPSKVTKNQRFLSKNKFVFPEFYGSYYKTCAADLELPERHVMRVEREFWQMYKGVKRWQELLVKAYDRTGYVELPLGFRRYAPLSKNQILNTPVQGTSFHMLLEAIRESDEEMVRRQMRSLIELEVHDSMVTDVVLEELDDVRKIQLTAMTRHQWDWQRDVPRSAEWLEGPNWGEQKEVKDALPTSKA